MSPFLFNSNKEGCNSLKLRGDYYKITYQICYSKIRKKKERKEKINLIWTNKTEWQK